MASLKRLCIGGRCANMSSYIQKNTSDLVNNGSYSGAPGQKALDAAYGKTLENNKVDRSGDTMTGALELLDDEFPTSIPSINEWHDCYILWKDVDENTIGYATSQFRSDGLRGLEFGTERIVNGNPEYNVVLLAIDENGNKKVILNRTAWLKALSAETININGAVCTGYITGAAQQIVISVPYQLISGNTFTLSRLNMAVRVANATNLFARSGSSGGVFTQIGPTAADIILNGAAVRSNELDSFSVSIVPNFGFNVTLNFKYALTIDRYNTGALVTNEMPIAVYLNIAGTIS